MDAKIGFERLLFEKLEEKHMPLLKNFKCTERELEKFLVDDALKNQKQKISATYLCLMANSNELVGYLTLLADAISLNADLKGYFKDKDIHYKSLPALKIGRMAVDERHMRKGIGSIMVRSIIAAANNLSLKIGCRFIVVDAKRSENQKNDALHFYKKHDFKILKEREKGTTAMYLNLQI